MYGISGSYKPEKDVKCVENNVYQFGLEEGVKAPQNYHLQFTKLPYDNSQKSESFTKNKSTNWRKIFLILGVCSIVAGVIIAVVVPLSIVNGSGPPTNISPTPTPEAQVPVCPTYPCLIFEDDFQTLNFKNWQHEITAGGGGNWEFQYYLNNRTNSYTKDGHLFLRPTLTSDRFGEAFLSSGQLDLWGSAPPNHCTGPEFYGCFRVGNSENLINPIQSARIRTVNKFDFRYGKVEVRARMPKGDWIWPAIWMLPVKEAYGNWPASGEIDLIETRGNLDLVDENGNPRGNTHGGATLHWGPYYPQDGYEKTTAGRDSDFGDSMHTYGMEWEEDEIRMYIDGEMVLRVDPGPDGFWQFGEFDQILPNEDSNPWRHSSSKMAPFDKEFYFVMNVAVGGTGGYFPDSWTNKPYPKPWSNTSPTAFRDFWNARDQWYPTWDGEDAAMEVDYIRVWKLKDN